MVEAMALDQFDHATSAFIGVEPDPVSPSTLWLACVIYAPPLIWRNPCLEPSLK